MIEKLPSLKLLLPLFLLLILSASTIAQVKKDKASFVPYSNEFYSQIKQELDGPQKEKKNSNRKFLMDLEGVDIPQSVDEFTTVWCQNPISQGRTGTCWCFSTSSFFESEIFRNTKKQVKLSELYIVYWEYVEKARRYVNQRGKSSFGEGSETNAVARMMEQYGVVPLAAYDGLRGGQPFHDHEAMFNEMKHFLEALKRDNNWNEEMAVNSVKAILNHYLGEPPTMVEVKGKKMTPQQYLKEVAQLQPTEYVNFMSLMEAPYYEKAVYNVPDNWWRSDNYYNVPLEDFMDILKNSIESGYSVALGGDVSESGYNAHADVAMVPSYDIPSDYIDEYARQLRFTNRSTTDDHAIHIVGYAKRNGSYWFLIKDSGSGARNGKNKGYYFYHEDYVKLKMMSFTVHKDAAADVLKLVNK